MCKLITIYYSLIESHSYPFPMHYSVNTISQIKNLTKPLEICTTKCVLSIRKRKKSSKLPINFKIAFLMKFSVFYDQKENLNTLEIWEKNCKKKLSM